LSLCIIKFDNLFVGPPLKLWSQYIYPVIIMGLR
jgi:hypothetical protein